jgi:hypothetical protein
MARGWESKSVEAQQEEAVRRVPAGPPRTAESAARAERRQGLELARKRAADDLERATAAAHRTMLQQAIRAIDEQLARLEHEST